MTAEDEGQFRAGYGRAGVPGARRTWSFEARVLVIVPVMLLGTYVTVWSFWFVAGGAADLPA